MASPIITFLTDFGTKDGYAGSVKGAIKSIARKVEIIDVSHDIPAFDVKAGAFALLNYYSQFPAGTIHLVVVDPGVGGARRAVILQTDRYYFVGPDNGVFHFVEQRDPFQKFELNERLPLFKLKGATFHGRDLFGPAAAWLASGKVPQDLGVPIADEKTKSGETLFWRKEGTIIECQPIAIDRFGNIITGISRETFAAFGGKFSHILINREKITEINRFYSQKSPQSLMALWNSLDLLEISVNQGSAAERLKFDLSRDKVYIYLNER